MNKKIILLLVGIFSATVLWAQKPKTTSWIWGPSVGWKYQSGNFLTLSGWGLFAPNDHQYIKIDGGANFSWMRNQTTVVPELGATYYLSDKLIFPFIGAEVTPYTATPKIGIGILSLVDIAIGYGWQVQQKADFKAIEGVSASIKVNIPFNFYLD